MSFTYTKTCLAQNVYCYLSEIKWKLSENVLCFFMRTDLEKCSIASLAQQWILCSEWVPSEWESKQFTRLESCGLLWCFYQLFGLSFWRHPFTAEDPLVSKWCTFLQICSDEETSSSHLSWGWAHFLQTFILRWTTLTIRAITTLVCISSFICSCNI